MELAILNWMQAQLRCGMLDAVLPWVSRICDHGEVWILLAAVLLLHRKTRRVGAAVTLALLLDLLCCNVLLKPAIARVRPCDVNTALALLIPRPEDGSFPSGHSAASFAAVAALLGMESRLWRPAFVLAVLICFSRLYLYVHWPSDVLAGVVLGTLLGFLAARIIQRGERRLAEKRGTSLPGGRQSETLRNGGK